MLFWVIQIFYFSFPQLLIFFFSVFFPLKCADARQVFLGLFFNWERKELDKQESNLCFNIFTQLKEL